MVRRRTERWEHADALLRGLIAGVVSVDRAHDAARYGLLNWARVRVLVDSGNPGAVALGRSLASWLRRERWTDPSGVFEG